MPVWGAQICKDLEMAFEKPLGWAQIPATKCCLLEQHIYSSDTYNALKGILKIATYPRPFEKIQYVEINQIQ